MDVMKINKKKLVIIILLILCAILIFAINRYGIAHLMVIFNRLRYLLLG